MIKVPVVLQFGDKLPIGHLYVDETKLPDHGGYVFTLGGTVESIADGKPADWRGFKLKEVVVLTDEQYAEYLKQKGV